MSGKKRITRGGTKEDTNSVYYGKTYPNIYPIAKTPTSRTKPPTLKLEKLKLEKKPPNSKNKEQEMKMPKKSALGGWEDEITGLTYGKSKKTPKIAKWRLERYDRTVGGDLTKGLDKLTPQERISRYNEIKSSQKKWNKKQLVGFDWGKHLRNLGEQVGAGIAGANNPELGNYLREQHRESPNSGVSKLLADDYNRMHGKRLGLDFRGSSYNRLKGLDIPSMEHRRSLFNENMKERRRINAEKENAKIKDKELKANASRQAYNKELDSLIDVSKQILKDVERMGGFDGSPGLNLLINKPAKFMDWLAGTNLQDYPKRNLGKIGEMRTLYAQLANLYQSLAGKNRRAAWLKQTFEEYMGEDLHNSLLNGVLDDHTVFIGKIGKLIEEARNSRNDESEWQDVYNDNAGEDMRQKSTNNMQEGFALPLT